MTPKLTIDCSSNVNVDKKTNRKRKMASHSYSDRKAFERLMLLIVTLIKYPGIGGRNPLEKQRNNQHYNALKAVQEKLREEAKLLKIELKDGYPSIPTLRKDLTILKHYKILDDHMYTWGYYLGTGVMSKPELKAAFDALESQAINQGDPTIREIYYQLKKRLTGFEFDENNNDFFYPVRQHLNRAIDYTDPQEMAERGENRHNLYHHIEEIENVIVQGQAIEIIRQVDLYKENQVGSLIVWPLQLIYYNIAWYLLFERYDNGLLVIVRINRFGDYCRILEGETRNIKVQKNSLDNAYKLLKNGWGLNLGQIEEQKSELEKTLQFIEITVRFFSPVSAFIEEGELRHKNQKIEVYQRDTKTQQPLSLDYRIKLPPRSINEFYYWVQGYGDKAQFLAPEDLVIRHHETAKALLARYET